MEPQLPSPHPNERGIAMITTLLVLMLMSALLVGFTTVVMSDQRYRFIDRDRGQAFYAASAGIEKLTADLGNLFLENVAPTATQIQNLTTTPPAISGIVYAAAQAPAAIPASQLTTYHCSGRDPVTGAMLVPATKTPTPVGGTGYSITFCMLNSSGNPTISDDNLVISGTGPYAGMTALQTPYQIDVTAKTATGGEVHLIRSMQTVAIPVFQFGIFSDSDLSFFAAETFGFGGRIHTNGNLWLAEGTGQTLTTNGKITAVGDVVRQFMSNGISTSLFMGGTVSLATSINSPTGNRSMALGEGSVNGTAGSAANPNWQTISLGATGPTGNYNGFIKNTATGAKKLSLPITATGVGGTNIDIIRRPCIAGAPSPCTGTADDPTSILYNERLFTKASVRILLSDTAADITNIPGVTAAIQPVSLEGINWNTTPPNNGTAYGGVNAANGRPPIAMSSGVQTMNITATTANPWNTISVNNPINYFKPASGVGIIAVGVGGPVVQNGVACTGRTPTTLTGCTVELNVLGIASGQTVTALINGQTISTTLSAPWTVGSPTMTVNSTAGFAPSVFWLKPNAGQPVLVSCTTLTSPPATAQLQGCAGLPASAININNAISAGALSSSAVGLIGGYLKVEKASNAVPPVWTDVTMEFLNYGFGDTNLAGATCGTPSPNAIIRLQRLKDNAGAGGGGCSYASDITGYRDPTNWWPNVLFDTREGALRDQDPGNQATGVPLSGVMYYVSLDVKNLAKWFNAVAPYVAGTGAGSKTDNGGYTVYFSDRRNNRNATNLETGEFGWEDNINPGVATGAPNGVCDVGEDVNGNGSCTNDKYGGFTSFQGVYNSQPTGAVAPLTTAATLTTLVTTAQAETNRALFFRHALKLVNGGTINSDATVANRISGLTVVSENPVYIQGDWNAVAATWGTAGELHAATAVIADAVTLLSNPVLPPAAAGTAGWNDTFSFAQPYTYAANGRLRTIQSYYRVAVLGGKGVNFPLPSDVSAATGGVSVFGTDGGPHNFLRMIEQDGGNNDTVNYRGSMASLYYNRQGTGTFKCCSGFALDGIVYSVPIRNFIFDTDFLQPALLPPNTPMFRDVNVIGFSQELRPGK